MSYVSVFVSFVPRAPIVVDPLPLLGSLEFESQSQFEIEFEFEFELF